MIDIQNFRGCGTALVTPFKEDGTVDEERLKNLVTYQIEGGIDFLVPCGTTGESATLSISEHLRIIEIVVKAAGDRVPVVAGVGSNDTAHVIHMANEAKKIGADAILSVTPYYNKPTQEGLYQHYKTIAGAVDLPIILYNVPGRTAVNLLPATVVRLSKIDNIFAIKEASGDIAQIAELAVTLPDNFKILSGDDSTTLPIMALGAVGVISVISNQAPALMTQLVHFCLDGKYREARDLQAKLFTLMNLNFIETSPAPVKAGLSMIGLIKNKVRLPLVPMSTEKNDIMKRELRKLELI